MSERIISICIPNYNRFEMLFEVFDQVIDNDSISEVIIVDDASEIDIYDKVKELSSAVPKIKLFRNDTNKDCYFNKKTAIERAANKWCCLWDSDNIFGFDYLYKLFQITEWDRHTIYAPDFAMPSFSYERFSGLEITRGNVSRYMNEPMFEVCLNTCNFFVNRYSYLQVFDDSVDPVTSDSIYFCLKWLEAGFKIKIVDGLKYHHRIHDNSHYNSNVNRTPIGLHDSIINRLKCMK